MGDDAVRAPDERRRRAHVDDREGPAAALDDHRGGHPRPGRPTATASPTRSTGPRRLVPRLRQRVVSNPLSIAPPRWEVDPNFDLDFHLRWLRAPGDGTLRDVLDMAEPIAMQGFDRARPLWEFTVVEGLDDGQAALILKLHHAITDGVGGIKIAMHLFDLERDGGRPRRACRTAPEVARPRPSAERFVDALDHERRRQLGIARRSAGTVTRRVTGAAATPPAPPGGSAETAALGRPHARPGHRAAQPDDDGPVAERPLRHPHRPARRAEGGGQAGRAASSTTRSSPPSPAGCAATTTTTAQPVDALRMTMPINVRNDETADLAGNQFVPARFAVPLDDRRPGRAHAGHPRRSWPSSGASRRSRSPSRWPGCSTGCRRRSRPASSARCCGASTSSPATCPACRSRSSSPAPRSRRSSRSAR